MESFAFVGDVSKSNSASVDAGLLVNFCGPLENCASFGVSIMENCASEYSEPKEKHWTTEHVAPEEK